MVDPQGDDFCTNVRTDSQVLFALANQCQVVAIAASLQYGFADLNPHPSLCDLPRNVSGNRSRTGQIV